MLVCGLSRRTDGLGRWEAAATARERSSRKMVTLQAMVLGRMYESEAWLTVLARKGLGSRAEVMDEAKRLQKPEAR